MIFEVRIGPQNLHKTASSTWAFPASTRQASILRSPSDFESTSLMLPTTEVQPEAVCDGNPLGLCHFLQSFCGRALWQHTLLPETAEIRAVQCVWDVQYPARSTKDKVFPKAKTKTFWGTDWTPHGRSCGKPTARDHAPVTSMRLDSWIHWWVRVGGLAWGLRQKWSKLL